MDGTTPRRDSAAEALQKRRRSISYAVFDCSLRRRTELSLGDETKWLGHPCIAARRGVWLGYCRTAAKETYFSAGGSADRHLFCQSALRIRREREESWFRGRSDERDRPSTAATAGIRQHAMGRDPATNARWALRLHCRGHHDHVGASADAVLVRSIHDHYAQHCRQQRQDAGHSWSSRS